LAELQVVVFCPGQSGNPSGRPRTRGLVNALRAKVEEAGPDGRSLEDRLVGVLLQEALSGRHRLAAVEVNRERELDPDTVWKTHSTKVTYEGYLNKWILPRWEAYPLVRVNAGEVELWLRSLPLARSSCSKIRNLMSVVFNHGIRHEICDRNPIQLVQQSAKRKAVPVILSASEVQRLIAILGIRERTLVLLAFGTGLRMSELFGLKWHDIVRIRFHKDERLPSFHVSFLLTKQGNSSSITKVSAFQ
jgi:integrase